MTGQRRTPRKHTVHTQDPRYVVPQYGRGSGEAVRLAQVSELSSEDQLKTLESQMWVNYDEQMKLRKRIDEVGYRTPEGRLLTDKVNDLIGARRQLDREFNRLKREQKNTTLKAHGFREGDRVSYVSHSPFHVAFDEVIQGRVVAYRGRFMVELDTPVSGKRYAALGKAWRREN